VGQWSSGPAIKTACQLRLQLSAHTQGPGFDPQYCGSRVPQYPGRVLSLTAAKAAI
jgi:hypothetical protein